MVEEGQYDPMEAADYGSTVLHWFEGSPTVFQWLLDQEAFLIDLHQSTSDGDSVAHCLLYQSGSDISHYLEAVIQHKRRLKNPTEFSDFSQEQRLGYASCCLPYMADELDFPNRIRVLWGAGADLRVPESLEDSGTMLDELLFWIVYRLITDRGEDAVGYHRVEDISTVHFRSRTSKSMWKAWYPGHELSVLEVVQRYLDAWMEVLVETGINVAEYGRREDQLHPEGVLPWKWEEVYGEARVVFEYGDHLDGCRIHVTEIWKEHDLDDESATLGEDDESSTYGDTSAMPCSWNSDDE